MFSAHLVEIGSSVLSTLSLKFSSLIIRLSDFIEFRFYRLFNSNLVIWRSLL